MIANYHTHTYHCNHAAGVPRDYIETAIKNGLETLGFSDHVPYPFPNGFKSGIRMSVPETADYVAELAALKEEYKDKIEILIGYEAEYYPNEFNDMIKNLEKYGYDYLILGQHFVPHEYDGVYTGTPCGEDTLKAYTDQLITAIATQKFSYIAHPDVINYRDEFSVFKKHILRLCDACVKYDVPLEFNLLGFMDKRHYPYDKFWEIVSETDCKVIIGCDAHSPEYTGKPDIFNAAVSYLNNLGIKPIDKLQIKRKG